MTCHDNKKVNLYYKHYKLCTQIQMDLKTELLEKLPFRLVVNEILIYIIYDTTRDGHKEFACFGYFRNDRFRKLFGIFKSVFVSSCYLILPRMLFSVTIYNIDIIFQSDFLHFHRKYKNIRNLNLINNNLDLSPLFDNQPFENLDSLNIINHKTYIDLKKINLRNLILIDYQAMINVDFEYLEKITLINVKLDNDISILVKRSSSTLKYLHLELCNINELIFRSVNFPKLKYLKLNNLLITGKNWLSFLFLQQIKLINCQYFEDNFFRQQQLKHIKNIYIHGCPKITGAQWNQLQDIHEIKISSSRSFKFLKFIKNQDLRKLTIYHFDIFVPCISIFFPCFCPSIPNFLVLINNMLRY